MELNAAMQLPEPHKYESRLPIHQDGTCNGLQHYAALGGDQLGAEAVNLVGRDRPSDVYGNVAKLVSAQVQIDAEAGDKMASLLVGRISRKVVKQTVMTTVYGESLNLVVVSLSYTVRCHLYRGKADDSEANPRSESRRSGRPVPGSYLPDIQG